MIQTTQPSSSNNKSNNIIFSNTSNTSNTNNNIYNNNKISSSSSSSSSSDVNVVGNKAAGRRRNCMSLNNGNRATSIMAMVMVVLIQLKNRMLLPQHCSVHVGQSISRQQICFTRRIGLCSIILPTAICL